MNDIERIESALVHATATAAYVTGLHFKETETGGTLLCVCGAKMLDDRTCPDDTGRITQHLIAGIRDVVEALRWHYENQIRRAEKFGRDTSECVCDGCNAMRALTHEIERLAL